MKAQDIEGMGFVSTVGRYENFDDKLRGPDPDPWYQGAVDLIASVWRHMQSLFS